MHASEASHLSWLEIVVPKRKKKGDIVGVHCIDQQWVSKEKWMVILTNQFCLIVAYVENLAIMVDHVLYGILQIFFSLVYLNR